MLIILKIKMLPHLKKKFQEWNIEIPVDENIILILSQEYSLHSFNNSNIMDIHKFCTSDKLFLDIIYCITVPKP